jgi:hypothetical protein
MTITHALTPFKLLSQTSEPRRSRYKDPLAAFPSLVPAILQRPMTPPLPLPPDRQQLY